jgi:hypothetical protein
VNNHLPVFPGHMPSGIRFFQLPHISFFELIALVDFLSPVGIIRQMFSAMMLECIEDHTVTESHYPSDGSFFHSIFEMFLEDFSVLIG